MGDVADRMSQATVWLVLENLVVTCSVGTSAVTAHQPAALGFLATLPNKVGGQPAPLPLRHGSILL